MKIDMKLFVFIAESKKDLFNIFYACRTHSVFKRYQVHAGVYQISVVEIAVGYYYCRQNSLADCQIYILWRYRLVDSFFDYRKLSVGFHNGVLHITYGRTVLNSKLFQQICDGYPQSGQFSYIELSFFNEDGRSPAYEGFKALAFSGNI